LLSAETDLRIAVGPVSIKWMAFAASVLDAASNPAATRAGSSQALRWLMHLGAVGIFALAVIDSSVIPIPLPGSTDLVLLLLTAFRSQSMGSPVLFASCAFVGSVIGGYTTWAAGKRGGEAALDRLGKGRFVRHVQGWVKRNGLLSVGLASLLPPPVPLMPFLFAAGAAGLARGRFLISYCTARAARYGVVAWMGYKYGRQVINFWQNDLKGWSTIILIVYISLLVLGVLYGIWKYRRGMRKGN
jgi:membrane protein DedA with SNARE-associated domain